MEGFIVASLAVGYITFVFCYSKIAEPVRRFVGWLKHESSTEAGKVVGNYFHGMLECPFCTGFWVSIGVESALWLDVLGASIIAHILVIPALALIGAALAWGAGWMIGKVEL